jgi:hypothetical protein
MLFFNSLQRELQEDDDRPEDKAIRDVPKIIDQTKITHDPMTGSTWDDQVLKVEPNSRLSACVSDHRTSPVLTANVGCIVRYSVDAWKQFAFWII